MYHPAGPVNMGQKLIKKKLKIAYFDIFKILILGLFYKLQNMLIHHNY